MLKEDDFVFLVTGQRDGDYRMSYSAKKEITTEVAKKIIEKLLVEASKKDPTIVRLLFTGSLNALAQDEQVGLWFKEITGNDLKDQFGK